MAITKGAASVSIDVWLEVIPQIIARIHISKSLVRKKPGEIKSITRRVSTRSVKAEREKDD